MNSPLNGPMKQTVLIMAGGTGGHVFPALAAARVLRERGFEPVWLGTRKGLEAKLVPPAQIEIEWISMSGLRGKGAATLLLAPFKVAQSIWQSLQVIRRRKPVVVLGCGGFVVCMLPGALAFTYVGYVGREALAGDSATLVRHGLIALALLAAVAFLPRVARRLREKPMLDVDALKARVERAQGLILDVRTAAEFAGEQGHIGGALNIPLEELEARLGELGADPSYPIAIVCRTDRRSAKAATLLARHGFLDVRVVRGGMTAWLAHGWPRER